MNELLVKQLIVKRRQKTILSDLNFSLSSGDLLAIIGPNGAGKTSLLDTIANPRSHHSGSVSFFGSSLTSWTGQALARRMCYLEQGTHLNFALTVSEVISMSRIPHSTDKKTDDEIIHETLDTFELTHLTHRAFTQLSGGEQQRVQLARIFAQVSHCNQDVCLQLLDEPLTGLDIKHQHQVMQYIRKTQDKGHISVVVLHDLNLAMHYANKILILKDGKQLAFGKTRTTINEKLLRDTFEHSVSLINDPSTGNMLIGY